MHICVLDLLEYALSNVSNILRARQEPLQHIDCLCQFVIPFQYLGFNFGYEEEKDISSLHTGLDDLLTGGYA